MAPTPRPSQNGLGRGAPTRGVDRLRRRQDFLAVLNEGKRVRHRLVAIGVRANGLPETRVGYAIGKRVGPAVVRNRTRRRLREIVRALPIARGYDLVITGYAPSADAPYGVLREVFTSSARRAGILTESAQTL